MNEKIEKIYNIAFDLIEIRLNKKESVSPFVVIQESNKEVPTISMYEQGFIEITSQLDYIRKDLSKKMQAGQIESFCLCYDVKVTDPRTDCKTDAIEIEIADLDTTREVYVPYDFRDESIIKKPFTITS